MKAVLFDLGHTLIDYYCDWKGPEMRGISRIHDLVSKSSANPPEKEEFVLDGGQPECPPREPERLETAMDTDSDEMDFTTQDRFAGQVTREEAEYEFEQLRKAEEEEEEESRK